MLTTETERLSGETTSDGEPMFTQYGLEYLLNEFINSVQSRSTLKAEAKAIKDVIFGSKSNLDKSIKRILANQFITSVRYSYIAYRMRTDGSSAELRFTDELLQSELVNKQIYNIQNVIKNRVLTLRSNPEQFARLLEKYDIRINSADGTISINNNGNYPNYLKASWKPIHADKPFKIQVTLDTLRNTYNFFALYANTDDLDPRCFNVPYENREEIDKWILSKYNKLVKEVTESYDSFDLTKVVRKITDFVSEDLSNWYIRRTRRRFWASELDDNKKAVYNTTYEVLEGLCKLIAPIASFVAEEIYTSLTNKESVHLEDFPVYDESKINEDIEKKMDLVRNLISLGRNAREEAKIKVRQPISEIILDGKNKDIISDLTDLIKEELNVKQIVFTDNLNKYISYEIKPNFKVCGPILGKNIKDFANYLTTLSSENISDLEKGNTLEITINDNPITLSYDMLDVRINSKKGFNASNENNNFIILNTTLTPELMNEGVVREFISKVQQIRKTNDYEMMDRITIYHSNNEEFNKSIKNYIEFIKKETLADELIISDTFDNIYDLNGIEVGIKLEKKN